MTQPARTSSEQPQPQPHQKPKRRWFQFGLRTLFIVMTLVCVGLGWLIHHVRQREAVVLMIEELDGRIVFGEPSFLGRMAVVRSLFGEHAFVPITGVSLGSKTTDVHLKQLKQLKKLNWLWLSGTQVSDLSPLVGLHGLAWLDLSGTQVSDLSPLSGLRRLTTLDLRFTKVSDLSPLSGLSELTSLNLSDTQVSDLSSLSGLSELSSLDLCDTQVSDLSPLVGLEKLQNISLFEYQKVPIPVSLEKVIQLY